MSIVSGLATATGVSSLLNAPRDNNLVLRFVAGDPAPQATVRRAEEGTRAAARFQTGRPVVATPAPGAPTGVLRESRDPRYTQFLDAVMALRTDLSEETLSSQRVAELRDAAKEIFRLEGVPEDKRPGPADAEVLARQARDEAAERTARQQDAAPSARAAERADTTAESALRADNQRLDQVVDRPAKGAESVPVGARTELAELPVGLVGADDKSLEAALPKMEQPKVAAPAQEATSVPPGTAAPTSKPPVPKAPEPAV